jgi:hypothetical protein
VASGMDTMCTKSDDADFVPEIAFQPVKLMYLRLRGTDANGTFSCSEISFSCRYLD